MRIFSSQRSIADLLCATLLTAALLAQFMGMGTLNHFSAKMLMDCFAVNGGVKESLPSAVIDAKTLLESVHASDVKLSTKLGANSTFQQRFGEFAFPIRLADGSSNLLTVRGEGPQIGCHLAAENRELMLYVC